MNTADANEMTNAPHHAAITAFFTQYGTEQSLLANKTIFTKNRLPFQHLFAQQKMYLLQSGCVALNNGTGTCDITAGELFGDCTPYHQGVFNATTATICQLSVLNEQQLLQGFKQAPSFILVMMERLLKRLRRDNTACSAPQSKTRKNTRLDKQIVQALLQQSRSEITVIAENNFIFQEGHAALLMYVLLEGSAVIHGQDNSVIWEGSSGDVIGEIALLDQGRRTTSVMARSRCTLLPITRHRLLELIQCLPEFSLGLLRVLASRSYLIRTTDDHHFRQTAVPVYDHEDDNTDSVPRWTIS